VWKYVAPTAVNLKTIFWGKRCCPVAHRSFEGTYYGIIMVKKRDKLSGPNTAKHGFIKA
jgi:hypothetical protein